MAEPNKENGIGMFDATFFIMEDKYRQEGAAMSGQGMRALHAGNEGLFLDARAQIGKIDADLSFIRRLRAALATELKKRDIKQPGLSMAAMLHEYMQKLSGISGQTEALTQNPGVNSSNGNVQTEPALLIPGSEPILPSTANGSPPKLEQDTPPDHKPEPAITEPVDPLVEFKALIPEESNWDISSRPLTKKLADGRLPKGIRPARVTLASVKYGPDLERLNLKRSRAIQEGYADGSGYANVPTTLVDHAVTSFLNDYMNRESKRLRILPQEVQDTIQRIKKDPILGSLSQSATGQEKLLDYALYKHSLQEVLLEGSPTPNFTAEDPIPAAPYREIRAREVRVPELAPEQLKTILTYLRIYIEDGWPENMRREVTLELYRDQIPAAGTVLDSSREADIQSKMASVARERTKAEKKIQEAIALMERGIKPSATMQQVEQAATDMLGVEKVTLSEVLDLMNKRVTPDQLRQKGTNQSVEEQKRQTTEPEAGEKKQEEAAKPEGQETASGKEGRNPEDLQEDEEIAFYALLALDENGLEFKTVEEACASAYREELEAITDFKSRMVHFELLCKKLTVDFNRGINRLEAGRRRGTAEEQPYLKLAINWLDDQELEGQKIYASRDSSTLRRIGAREVPLSQYLKTTEHRRPNRGSRRYYAGSHR